MTKPVDESVENFGDDVEALLNRQKLDTVPVDKLLPHPDNPRQGDVGAIVESIKANGFYGYVVAQTSTRHVIVGNHRLKAAKQLGMKTIPVLWMDITDDRAKRILLADNRTNDLASYDNEALAGMLKELMETDVQLEGTAFDEDALNALLEDIEHNFEPEDDDQPRLDQKKPVTCPNCDHEFTP